MSLLRQFRRHPAPNLRIYQRFTVAGRQVGWVKPDFARRLMAWPDRFVLDGADLAMHPNLANDEARSDAMAATLSTLREEGLVPGWRNEFYPVNTHFGELPLFVMERAAVPLFGVLAYGVNLNGFVGRGWGMKVWVARRAVTKAVDPNMLDHIVGGGQPLGLSPVENLIKECEEEAGIPAFLAADAVSVGIVTLMFEAVQGLRVDMQFNFDLELPADFEPQNRDGEVAGFELVPVSELIHRLRSEDSFMYDSAVVQIDFLIRHGFIGPEDPDYLSLTAGLRPSLPCYSLQAAV
jgi:8-oxo-dGTP pyrophosphatase MutT (NUDIX family)